MTRPDCPRLAAELAVLSAMAHTTKADLKRREAEHRAWHPCPHDYDPGHLPRDPERTTQ